MTTITEIAAALLDRGHSTAGGHGTVYRYLLALLIGKRAGMYVFAIFNAI